jgi:hypothetical protein
MCRVSSSLLVRQSLLQLTLPLTSTLGVYSVNSVILGWVSGTLGQTPEKKAISLSMVNMVSMASFIYTPYLYPKSDGPKYVTAMSSNASFACATVAAAWAMRIWLQMQNRKLKRDGGNVYYAY